MSCGAENEANAVFTNLTAGVDFEIPDINIDGPEYEIPGGVDSELYKVVTKLTNEDLVTPDVNGTGTFNVLMVGFRTYLEQEFKANRITGAEYTKAFTSMSASAMGGAVQFLLGRDTAMWAAINAQIQAVTARIQLQTAKVQLAAMQFEAENRKAEYALTKMKLARESSDYCISQFTLSNMLPAQLAMVNSQKVGQDRQNDNLAFTLANILPQQHMLLKEQTEVQRAQTSDNRTDGALVLGSVGKQKDLYTQQIVSYKRDSETKVGKLFVDAWITQKTIDEGLLPPLGFTNASMDIILHHLKTNNGLGA